MILSYRRSMSYSHVISYHIIISSYRHVIISMFHISISSYHILITYHHIMSYQITISHYHHTRSYHHTTASTSHHVISSYHTIISYAVSSCHSLQPFMTISAQSWEANCACYTLLYMVPSALASVREHSFHNMVHRVVVPAAILAAKMKVCTWA